MNQVGHVLGFIILDNIILYIGAVVFMYTEYRYKEVQPAQNATQVKTDIEAMINQTLNETQFNEIVSRVEKYVHEYEPSKSAKYTSTWKKKINTRTFIRWCYFAYTIVTTIGDTFFIYVLTRTSVPFCCTKTFSEASGNQ